MEENKFKNVKTSIRDIKISEKREKLESHVDDNNQKDNLPPQDNISFKKQNKKKWPKVLLGIFIFIIIFFSISVFFHSAHITIKPKNQVLTFNGVDIYKAVPVEQNNSEYKIDTIPYEIFDVSFSVEDELQSIGVEEKKEKAIGKIKIINNSNKNQKLRKETRFRNGNKIYMTFKSTTVPANSMIIVDAFATEPGEEYNIPVGVKFDIPGFEEIKSPLFTKMSGEVAEAFTGGLIGKTNIPNKNDLLTAQKNNEEKLKLMAKEQLINKIPKQYILVDSQLFKENIHKTLSEKNKVILKSSLNVKAILFKENDFIKLILGKNNIDSNLIINNIKDLKFKILSKEAISLDNTNEFNFTLNGRLEISWKFEKDAFLAMIKGHSEKEVKANLENNFKEFDIEIIFRPFWRASIPDDINKIKIEILEK